MSKRKYRVFGREMKVSAVRRMLAGADVTALARELKVRRALLYRWKDEYREAGSAAFRRRRGRPRKSAPGMDSMRSDTTSQLAAAQQRIAELERKVGRQELELDFFRKALWQVGAKRRPIDGPGAKPSTSSSKR
jgi:transposase-like protein